MNKRFINVEKVSIGIVLVVSFFLNFFYVWKDGYGNPYYASTVLSMGQSLKNFIFGSFDPSGFLAVDKPVCGFWIQVLFTKIFGFHGWSLILPQAIFGTLSVLLIYLIVKKNSGFIAGILSSVSLAVTPVFVAASRNNTIDTTVIFMILLSILFFMKYLENKKNYNIIAAAVLLGIGFNVKMITAFTVIPSYLLIIFLQKDIKITKRIIDLGIAILFTVIISLSYPFFIELTTKAERPHIANTNNNSLIELMVFHNGISRIVNNNHSQGTQNNRRPDQPPAGHENMITQEVGTPSIFRFFNKRLSYQISFFIVIIVAGSIIFFRKIKKYDLKLRNLYILVFSYGVILFIYFSFNSGVFHRYHLALIAPVFAVLTGIGFRLVKEELSLKLAVIILSLTLIIQILIASLYIKQTVYIIIPTVLVFITALILLNNKLMQKYNTVFIASFLCLTILPLTFSFTPIIYSQNIVIPYAGFDLENDELTAKNVREFKGLYKYIVPLSNYLILNLKNEKFLALTPSCNYYGSTLVLSTNKPVLPLGGFNGFDKFVSLEELKNLVETGQLRFAVIPQHYLLEVDERRGERPMMPDAIQKEIMEWFLSYGEVVDQKQYLDEESFDPLCPMIIDFKL